MLSQDKLPAFIMPSQSKEMLYHLLAVLGYLLCEAFLAREDDKCYKENENQF